MQRWTATCCKGASSTTIKRSIQTWNFSWHYGGMKEDALQKGHPVPDEAAVRERVLRENVDAPDLAAVKDFLRFHAATSKGKIQEEVTCDSLNTFAEWFFASSQSSMSSPPPRQITRQGVPGTPSDSHSFIRPELLERLDLHFATSFLTGIGAVNHNSIWWSRGAYTPIGA